MKRRTLILAAVLMTALCGCGKMSEDEIDPSRYDDVRFEVKYEQTDGISGGAMIIKDKDTGTRYLFIKNGYTGGLCELDEETHE